LPGCGAPADPGLAARGRIRDRMKLDQVMAIAGDPDRFSIVDIGRIKGGPLGQLTLSAQPPKPFSRAAFAQHLKAGHLGRGVVFEYRYPSGVAFLVTFDFGFRVIKVQDLER